ncbi:MAG: PaaI family thioesterase [Planctomycetes bacterium]|nr:PaaI family thioesterase [Planctomycetota bacterium]
MCGVLRASTTREPVRRLRPRGPLLTAIPREDTLFPGVPAALPARDRHAKECAVSDRAFQDYYPDDVAHCYGCGRLNEHGHRIRSFWDGEETVCRFEPRPFHTASPGFVYGGLIASLIDCHGTGTAAAAAYRAEQRAMDTEPPLRYVTASLHVDYLKPTPLGVVLEVRARIREVKGRKVVVTATLAADGQVTARGEVVAVRMPEEMMQRARAE